MPIKIAIAIKRRKKKIRKFVSSGHLSYINAYISTDDKHRANKRRNSLYTLNCCVNIGRFTIASKYKKERRKTSESRKNCVRKRRLATEPWPIGKKKHATNFRI